MRRPALIAALLLALAVPAPALAARQVPAGWLGMNLGGPAFEPGVDLPAETGRMVDAGVESLRVPAFWTEIQPREERMDFSYLDDTMVAAAARGLPVMLTLVGTPRWAAVRAGDVDSPPRVDAFAAFATTIARRYGPGGEFWAAHPELRAIPVRDYQIWNEPPLRAYWSIQPFAPGYVRLLRASYLAIKGVDPSARIVLAGLANFSWRDLAKVYRAGGRRWFDVAAVHPYTALVRNVVRIVALNRRTMARYHDSRTPIVVGELSWSSGRGHVRESQGFLALTESGQAARVAQALPALAAVRRRYRISQVFWFDWLSPPIGSPNAFDYSGLRRRERDGTIVSKPALAAFSAAAARLEGR